MRFVIWGDSKGKDNGINKKVLNSLMKIVSKLNPKPEFMVMVGDTVKGSLDEKIFIKQLVDLKNIINNYTPGITLLPVVGNHEVNISPKDDRYEKILSQFYKDFNPLSALNSYNNTVYCKDFKNIRIIILNSHHPNEIHKISQRQLSWLENITYDCNKIKLLFVHSPAFPTGAHLGHCLDMYPRDRDKFWNIIEECNVNMVFSGHEHNYSRRFIKNNYNSNSGIMQVITGGAGEKLKNQYKSKEGIIVPPIPVFHFLLADVTYDCIKFSAITTKGKLIDSFNLYYSK